MSGFFELSYHLQKHVVTRPTPALQVSEDAFEIWLEQAEKTL